MQFCLSSHSHARLRSHVGGVFMPCDRRGVSYTIFILVFTLHYMFSEVFK